jgi:hypothetical protein
MIDIPKMFNTFDEEFAKFDRVLNPLSTRPDLCACGKWIHLCQMREMI